MPVERTLAVIQTFYDAALDAALWPTALKKLMDHTGSQASSFWVLDGSQNPCLPIFNYINFDQESIREYLAHMAPLDPTVRYLVAHPELPIVHDGLLGDLRDEDSRLYGDWHGRSIETRFRMVAQVRVAPTVQSGVALHRTKTAGRYESEEIARFSVLHRHLERALAIGFRLGSLEAMQQLSLDWLDRHHAAIILCDHRMRILFGNRTAQHLQSSADGISWSTGGIALACQRDHRRLQLLIAAALSSKETRDSPMGGALRIRRPSGKRPYAIFVSPISRQLSTLTFFRPAVCVLIVDPDSQRPMASEGLQRLFGLTKAEARLAILLARGEDLRRIADQLQITYGSARSRLAQIFAKTETRRQGELISLLLTTAGSCDRPFGTG